MAKRFTKPSINWVDMEKRVPPNQKVNFLAFKAKSDAYLRRVQASPPEPPKIDWEAYRKTVPIPDLVDKFQKEYECFEVPYPNDSLSSQIDAQWKSLEGQVKAFCQEQDKEIESANKELTRVKALPKFEDMTMETFKDMYPNMAIDPVAKPSFWPHTEEEQPGYLTAEQKAMKAGGGH